MCGRAGVQEDMKKKCNPMVGQKKKKGRLTENLARVSESVVIFLLHSLMS